MIDRLTFREFSDYVSAIGDIEKLGKTGKLPDHHKVESSNEKHLSESDIVTFLTANGIRIPRDIS